MAIWCAALNDLMHCLHVSPDQRRLGLWDASILLEPFVPEVPVQIDEQQRHCDKQERRQHICELASTLPTSRIKTSDVCRKRERDKDDSQKLPFCVQQAWAYVGTGVESVSASWMRHGHGTPISRCCRQARNPPDRDKGPSICPRNETPGSHRGTKQTRCCCHSHALP